MKIVFRVSTRISYMAAGPRDFFPIAGLDHLGVVFQSKVCETPEEVNEVHTQLSDPRYPNAGCQFYAYALTAEDEAKLNAAAKPVIEEPKLAETSRGIGDAITPLNTETTAAPEFSLEGKSIMLNGERIAGLFGDDKQLRVVSAHTELRPAIESWISTLPTTSDT